MGRPDPGRAAMKRFAAVVVVLLLAVAGLQAAMPTAQAQEVSITLSVAEVGTGLADVQTNPGQQVVMRITAAGTESMAGIQFDLVYDSTVLSVDSVVQVDSGFFEANATQPGVITIVTASATASGVSPIDIADITFEVIGGPGDSTTLSFAEAKAFDGSIPPDPIPVTPAAGSINTTCTLVVDVTFADGITTWSFVVGATEPSTWSTSVVLLGNDIPLWSIALPALPPINKLLVPYPSDRSGRSAEHPGSRRRNMHRLRRRRHGLVP